MTGTYICDPGTCHGSPQGRAPVEERHCWHLSTLDRLAWHYGAARAKRMMLGGDAKTNADISAWTSLGQRREIAA